MHPDRSRIADMPRGWDNFYYLIGSAAASLTGLLFVVMTLTAGRERSRILRGVGLYMMPTVVHFGVVLSVSAVTLAPGLPAVARGIVFCLFAIGGSAASIRASVGIGRPREGAEAPHWSDFWCYGAAPTAIYLGLVAVATAAFWAGTPWAPFAMAGLLLSLLLLGIRNAWDLITSIAPAPPQANDSG
jgi:hypothetical protein